MPKRSKKQANKTDEHEGRPPDLTLASFVQLPSAATSFANPQDDITEAKSSASLSCKESEQTLCDSEKNDDFESTDNAAASKPVYYVGKTKKGKLPLSCENRSKGKKVTVISNVTGEANALLHELKKRAGCGGVLRDGNVELQGDRVLFVSKFLNGNTCLQPYKP